MKLTPGNEVLPCMTDNTRTRSNKFKSNIFSEVREIDPKKLIFIVKIGMETEKIFIFEFLLSLAENWKTFHFPAKVKYYFILSLSLSLSLCLTLYILLPLFLTPSFVLLPLSYPLSLSPSLLLLLCLIHSLLLPLFILTLSLNSSLFFSLPLSSPIVFYFLNLSEDLSNLTFFRSDEPKTRLFFKFCNKNKNKNFNSSELTSR